ncbi:DNA integrity scanning protein DisA nucleotide-binding domain protein [Arthrobacter sp. DNA4]|uniref:diadenylate cyclase n=1 Tax=Arthrobacter sp. DNA4 TaxID=2963432 RepID=UPI0020CD074C|nr:diadenylate cyclase [Arthrobacter sp. DNA4]UTT69360.1 DNA integrity scanning protein DisA nucleotide-binding domain protein [Arthrobacter sp. DNA4]
MRDTIQQFMWGFQPHFRSSLTFLAKHALSSIGVEVAPEAYLVGFREAGNGPWPICVEPETGPYSPDLLGDVLQNADQLYEVHPDRNVLHTHPDVHERFVRGLVESCRMKALSSALGNSDTESERTFFVGYPGHVGDYRVYPVISVLRSRWGLYPQLDKEQSFSRISTRPSLQSAVLWEILDLATSALGRAQPPQSLGRAGDNSADVVRHAAHDFVNRLVTVHGDWMGGGFPEAMEAVAAQPYEGRTGIGTIVLAKEGHPQVITDIRFSNPIVLRETRSFRKALEMTGVNLHLLSDGIKAYGLGRVSDGYKKEAENLYSVKVVGRGSWELSHVDSHLLRLDYGMAKLPQERISEEKFFDTVERVFHEDGDARALWELTLAAAEQQHGTMLVIHREAELEAKRLAPQALAIEPRPLESEALASLTAIDGAILVAPNGHCHAVGVILDGTAVTGTGDAARGARYNLAVRYHHAMPEGSCIIVIVSEDGMINLLPSLARRVKLSAVEHAVRSLEEASEGDVEFEKASRHDRHVAALAFYLSGEQCNRVNAARERIEEARERSGSAITRVGYDLVKPNPKMNDSYFLPEE